MDLVSILFLCGKLLDLLRYLLAVPKEHGSDIGRGKRKEPVPIA